VCHWLLADNVKAFFKKSSGYHAVKAGWGGYDYCIDAIRSEDFFFKHLSPIGVDAIGCHEFLTRGGDCNRWINGHSAGGELANSVSPHRNEMSPSNNRVDATSNHPNTHAAAERLHQPLVHVFPPSFAPIPAYDLGPEIVTVAINRKVFVLRCSTTS
jgi:hypothetical protein